MTRNMNLRYPLAADAIEIFVGIEIVILRRHVDVVHIQENPAVGALDDLVEELPFGHLGAMKFGVATHVLDGDRHFQVILSLANFACRLLGRLERVRHGKQIVLYGHRRCPSTNDR